MSYESTPEMKQKNTKSYYPKGISIPVTKRVKILTICPITHTSTHIHIA
uniref:Uncharacterized protein n=1 Tax=Rhizophora mucronata TaxID=61149 RepID=A0A2P2PZW2_RHIMU